MPDDGIMLTLSAEEWALIVASLQLVERRFNSFLGSSRLNALIDKPAGLLNLDLEKLDG